MVRILIFCICLFNVFVFVCVCVPWHTCGQPMEGGSPSPIKQQETLPVGPSCQPSFEIFMLEDIFFGGRTKSWDHLFLVIV